MDNTLTKDDYKNKLILDQIKQVVLSLTQITNLCKIPFDIKIDIDYDKKETEDFIKKMNIIEKETQNIKADN